MIYDTSKPGVFSDAFGGTVPVLVLYTLEETTQEKGAGAVLRQRHVPGHEVGEGDAHRRGLPLVGEHFSGVDPVAVKAEMGFDKATWAYDGRIDKASFERGGKVWYRKGSDIPESRYEDLVDMSFLEPRRRSSR